MTGPIAGPWLLVDGSSLIFRAYFGVPTSLVTPHRRPVNAVRGFLDHLARYVTERRPSRVAVATDEDWRPQFRVDALPTYKTHRVGEGEGPDDLGPQVEQCYSVLSAIGVMVARAPGFEAEDVIASLAAGADAPVEILSGDRDLFALVRDPDVAVIYPQAGGAAIVDEAWIERKYGIPGRRYLDFALLRGDPSDGLPGLPGIGDKRAAALVRQYADLDALVLGANLSPESRDYLQRARSVVAPVANLSLPAPPPLPSAPVDPEALGRLVGELGIEGPVDRLLQALGAG
ncbi:MAG: 5'-3' exonuclease [Candidatus Dormibacteria bacterium]